MTTGKEMTIRQPDAMTITDMRTLAQDFVKSGYFQDAKELAQTIVKIQAGRELGLGPVYSMTKIYIVKNHVMVSAETMGALVKGSGRYDYRATEYTNEAVTLVFTDRAKDVFTSRFTMDDARKAELVKADGGWKAWPRAMLTSKALSQGARIVCPHVIAGVYTFEDFGVESTEDGQPTDVQVRATGEVRSKPDPTQEDIDAMFGDGPTSSATKAAVVPAKPTDTAVPITASEQGQAGMVQDVLTVSMVKDACKTLGRTETQLADHLRKMHALPETLTTLDAVLGAMNETQVAEFGKQLKTWVKNKK